MLLSLPGKVAMMSRRWPGWRLIHAPISAPVRPQPMQKPLAGSITQVLMQGVSMGMGELR
jgi:hypothetical protein